MTLNRSEIFTTTWANFRFFQSVGIPATFADCLRQSWADYKVRMDALVRLPYMLFPEYVPDGNRQYERGQVVREGTYKYLLQPPYQKAHMND